MGPLLLAAAGAFAADPAADEALRLQALAAIFPDMEVEQVARRIDSSFPLDVRPPLVFPDVLALDPAYRIAGPPRDERERCASRDLVNRTSAGERELRFRLFPWPGASRGELLAVVQYRFAGAQPSAECPSLAELFRLAPSGKSWKVADRFPLNSSRHHHLEGLQFLRLTGEPEPELVVESDSGDGRSFHSDLHVFVLAHARFQEILNVPSRMHVNVQGDRWRQTLAVQGTLQQHGEQFCFEKTVWAAGNRRFPVPEITHPCYARGAGVTPP